MTISVGFRIDFAKFSFIDIFAFWWGRRIFLIETKFTQMMQQFVDSVLAVTKEWAFSSNPLSSSLWYIIYICNLYICIYVFICEFVCMYMYVVCMHACAGEEFFSQVDFVDCEMIEVFGSLPFLRGFLYWSSEGLQTRVVWEFWELWKMMKFD